jgi:hypothetical protein
VHLLLVQDCDTHWLPAGFSVSPKDALPYWPEDDGAKIVKRDENAGIAEDVAVETFRARDGDADTGR